ncbi:MarR family winged helix-turn-helix transcriptional regulator [Burkholderiaceae bacterium DAT-1]|nr:MarR family winged helix-turn-helix transcriptional regulator [Burkholderiaceae bacterium DAT-1]
MYKNESQIGDDLQLDVAVLKQFRIIFKSVRKHFQIVEDALGISGAQLWALSVVVDKPGLRVTQLAEEMSLHQSTTSNLVEKLVELGHIRRERCSKDGRAQALFATETSVALMAKAPGPVKGLLPDALERLPYGTLRDLHRSLALLLQSMQDTEQAAGDTVPLSDA